MPPKGKADLAHHQAADWVIGTLGPAEAEDFRRHLTGCPHCQAAVAEFATVGQMLQHLPPAAEPPPELEARVIADVLASAAEDAPPAKGQPSEQDGGRTARVIRFPRWHTRAGLLAIAGAVAAAIAVALVILPGLSRGGPGQAVAFKLVSPTGQAASGTATARPDASGSWDITLTVRHLPNTDENQWYECWYVSPTQVASAGTFIVGASESGTFSMTSAVDPHDARTMEIRVESSSKDGRLRGTIVLSGQAET
jgi:anti-sigma-K factor RskA